MLNIIIALLGLLLNLNLWAFPCKLTVMKDSCWAAGNYNLTIEIIDNSGATQPSDYPKISLPIGVNVVSRMFECQPSQILSYKAVFDPSPWKQYENKVFVSTEAKNLPQTLESGETAWQISLCFSKDFSGVPTPIEGTPPCNCDYSSIPPIDKK